MNIITITLNPAMDIHYECDSLKAGADNSARYIGRYIGGKGVNVSSALKAMGVDSICYAAVGKDSAEEYLLPLKARLENVACTELSGQVRENIHIKSSDGDTVLATAGACVDIAAISHMQSLLLPIVGGSTVIAFCGSVPNGSDLCGIVDALLRFKACGARLIIDTRSFGSGETERLQPYLMKPNEAEFCALLGIDTLKESEIPSRMRDFCGAYCDNLLLTVGENGAYLASRGSSTVYKAVIPRISVKSSAGAGDASVAGYICALMTDGSPKKCLSEAMAFSLAACLSDGTEPPKRSDIDRCREEIEIIENYD